MTGLTFSARPAGAELRYRGRALCGQASLRSPLRTSLLLAGLGLAPLLAPAPGASQEAPSWLRRVDAGVRLEVESAVDTGTARFQKAEATLLPEVRLDFAGGHALEAIARVRLDAFDRLEPGRVAGGEVAPWSRRRSLGAHGEVELRELFLDLDLGRARLTLGKQQVVWGESDGLKLLDLVNPQEFREFILPPFDQSRIPLWTANLEVPLGPGTLQLLFIPDPSVHDIPPADGVFAFRSPQLLPPPVPGRVPILGDERIPDRAFEDADAGVRWRGQLLGSDFSAGYLYQHDDRPVFALDPTSPPGIARFDVVYERTHIVGATGSSAIGDWTLRGEMLWRSDRVLSTRDPGVRDRLHRTGELEAVVGLDWFGLRDTLLSVQLFQSLLLDDAPGLLRDAYETRFTLYAERRLWNDRLTLELQWIHDLLEGDGLLRPRASYEVRDGLDAWVGLDAFYGSESGLFGQYRANDRVVIGFELGI